MAKAAIILRSYNEADLIGRCLEAVFDQDHDNYEVILVDSESTDGTLEIARRFNGLRIVPIRKSDFTYGRALNVGLRAAASGTRIAAFLSAHAIPTTRHWLNDLTRPILDNPRVAACFGKQTPLPEHMSNRIVRHLAKNGYRQCYGDEAYVSATSHFFSNANGAIRYSCWHTNPFDEAMTGSEDAQWAKRMVSQDCSIAYAPDACVFHSHPDSILQYLRRYRNEERGNIVVAGRNAQFFSVGDYVRGLAHLAKTFGREMLRRRACLQEATDAFVVNGIILTAVYLERRRLKNQSIETRANPSET